MAGRFAMTIRFSHISVNVTDLARATDFYEAVTPLRRTLQTPAPAQSWPAPGIDEGRFSGVLLRDPRSPEAPAVHLIEWRAPRPTGRAYGDFTNPGFFRICFSHENAARVHDLAVAAGARPFGPPLMPEGQNITGRPVFSVPDPDGVVIQHVSLPGAWRLYHVCLNCRDLDATVAFLERLGLEVKLRSATDIPVPNSFGPPGGGATYRAALLGLADDPGVNGHPRFCIDVAQWTRPEIQGEPYPVQTHVGIVRLGLATDRLDSAHDALDRQGLNPGPITTRDYGGQAGIRRTFSLPTPDGATIELLDRPL